MLPGGYAVDWLAADTSTERGSVALHAPDHTQIAEDTDVGRDHIVDTVMAANPLITVEVIHNFSTGYHTRNGGGDLIQTDGDLPIIDLTRLDAPDLEAPEPTDSRDKRPAPTTFGASVAMLRTIYLGLGSGLAAVPFDCRPCDLFAAR